VIEVVDNGIGMAPDLVARAFDLFAQAERSSDRSSGGLGLGLALVRSLVELHGGTVACESAGLGEGSRFVIRLPRLPGQALGEAGGADGAGRACRLRPHHDRRRQRGRRGDAGDAAGSVRLPGQRRTRFAARAGTRARSERPEVCLLDIGLPGMDGIELARRLRAQPETSHALLVAVTGYGQDSDRERALAAGFDQYFVKPVDLEKLRGVLAGVPAG
jgi:CheY-like chemotaxis protein